MAFAWSFESLALWSILGIAIAALVYAMLLARQILREDSGSGRMREVWESILKGANAYLKTQFRSIVLFIALLTFVLYLTSALVGGPFQIAVGRAGAFLMGSIFSALVGYLGMNMAVRGNVRVASAARRSFRDSLRIAYRSGTITGMLTDGLGLFGGTIIFMIYLQSAPEVLLGFGFGGTLLALFMRVGGGIYTKAADVGADLVGKVEKNIPEDDPRNAAVVADLVGDNVGDCAGMAADIFESYEVTIVSCMILGLAITPFDMKWIIFPLLARGVGVISTIIGTYAVSLWPDRLTKGDAFKAMDLSYDLSAAISIASFFAIVEFYVHDYRVFLATAVGEMAGLEPEARQIMADLDAAGNTTKAVTKAIAIASAVLAAVSLFGAYTETTGLQRLGLNIADPLVFVGLLVGGALPFLFSSISIRAVGRAASLIVNEVRSQFKIPGVIEGKVSPDYAKVVTICTSAAQRELFSLALLAILTPIAIGFSLKEAALGGFLAGIIVTGQLLAVFMASSGGAWDNAKKKIEDGFYGGKGSEEHKASVTCDTVGDPLKDTSGPALNPMIKVINLISLLFAPMILQFKDQPLITGVFSAALVAIVGIVVWHSKRETILTRG